MRLKIISDGMPRGTRVVDEDTGEEVENIQGIAWTATPGEAPRAIIHVAAVPVDATADADKVTVAAPQPEGPGS